MSRPMMSQMMSRYQFSAGSENISSRQVAMPKIGTSGTNGARNGRFAFGFVLRMTMTAPQTMTKAKSVPMLVISASIESGMKPAIAATKMPVKMVDFQGVRNFG